MLFHGCSEGPCLRVVGASCLGHPIATEPPASHVLVYVAVFCLCAASAPTCHQLSLRIPLDER